MQGFRFSQFRPQEGGSVFDRLFSLFKEMLVYTSGDVDESLSWLTELDKEYEITTPEYGMGDFIEDLKRKGYLQEDQEGNGQLIPSPKTEKMLRSDALEQLFGKLKKGLSGQHGTRVAGKGDEWSGDLRPYEFGDLSENIAMTESIRNALIRDNSGFSLQEDDLQVRETEFKSQMSTVLMIDISHSMILYGEDRITPAKKVAMALAELISTRYPKDTLDILVFGDDAWQIEIKDLPYLQVGPFHTNTVAGLELAMDLLRRRKNPNKQIFMITDGKPSCLKEGNGYYQNSFGLDRKIVNRCLNMAAACKRLKIPINTFMIARDAYLQSFIQEFTEVNGGKAYFTGLGGLGEMILVDYARNKKRRY